MMSPDSGWFQQEDLLVFSLLLQVTSYVLAKKNSFLKTSKLDIDELVLDSIENKLVSFLVHYRRNLAYCAVLSIYMTVDKLSLKHRILE